MVGIPKGLFSLFPGLGIQTLLVGLTFEPIFNLFMSFRRATGDKDLTPSTQKRLFPLVFLGNSTHRDSFG